LFELALTEHANASQFRAAAVIEAGESRVQLKVTQSPGDELQYLHDLQLKRSPISTAEV